MEFLALVGIEIKSTNSWDKTLTDRVHVSHPCFSCTIYPAKVGIKNARTQLVFHPSYLFPCFSKHSKFLHTSLHWFVLAMYVVQNIRGRKLLQLDCLIQSFSPYLLYYCSTQIHRKSFARKQLQIRNKSQQSMQKFHLSSVLHYTVWC